MKTSRRTFLQSTALALTWGGLKLYAGHSHDPAVAPRPVPAHDFMLYVGTSFGAALLAGDAGALELLRSMVRPVAAPEVTAEKVRPRLMRGDGHSLLAVFNDTPRDQPARNHLPVEFKAATDIDSGNAIPISNHIVEFIVPNQDVKVLQLDA